MLTCFYFWIILILVLVLVIFYVLLIRQFCCSSHESHCYYIQSRATWWVDFLVWNPYHQARLPINQQVTCHLDTENRLGCDNACAVWIEVRMVNHHHHRPGGCGGWWDHHRLEFDNWVVVSNIFYFHPYLGKWSNLTNNFQMGWNHQLDKILVQLPTLGPGLSAAVKVAALRWLRHSLQGLQAVSIANL